MTIDKYANLTSLELQAKMPDMNFNKTKAERVVAAAKMIQEKHNGQVPDTLEELVEFKGVGPKVAHIVLQCAFGKVTGIPVDTHVHRYLFLII